MPLSANGRRTSSSAGKEQGKGDQMGRQKAYATAWMLVLLCCSAASAAETVQIGKSAAVLLRPSTPVASVILMPGGDGSINAGPNGEINGLKENQLVRTRNAYLAQGNAVLVVDADVELEQAVQFMRQFKAPITVIATSRGTIRAATGISHGAKPNALVLTSGFLTQQSGGVPNVSSILGTPEALPPTLVIHHRDDACKFTQPAGVEPFILWSAGRARAVWLTGGTSVGNPCQALAYHGFNGLDDDVVRLAAGFHGR
jgi:hypothetical protein